LAIVKLPLAGPTILTYAAVQFSGSTIGCIAAVAVAVLLTRLRVYVRALIGLLGIVCAALYAQTCCEDRALAPLATAFLIGATALVVGALTLLRTDRFSKRARIVVGLGLIVCAAVALLPGLMLDILFWAIGFLK
jgi:hypothetical protein